MWVRADFIAIAMVAASCSPGPPKAPAPGPTAASTQPRTYDELLAAARSYSEAGRGEQAASVAERAAGQAPSRPEAYWLWGRGLAQQKKLEQAVVKYEKARELGARGRDLFVELASILDVSGRYDEAIRVYRAWLGMKPDDVQMRQELGLTLLLRERFAEAVTELEKASRARPNDVQVRQDLGYALVRAGEPKRAERVLQAVVGEDPSRREAIVFLARAKALQGRVQEALALLDSVITSRQASEQALRMRAHLRLVTGNAQGSLDDYGWVLEARPDDPAALLGAAGALVALGRLDEAAAAVDKAAATVRSHPVVAFRRAQIAWHRGDAEAIDGLTTFARANPTSVEAWREVRMAAKKAGRREIEREATRALEKLGDLR